MSDIIQEAQRCLKCKRPLCKEGCPVRTEIPTIMQLFLDGKMDEAGKILFENNPLSAVCSLICPHEKNCMGHCVLNHKNSPIKFFEVENYISTFFLDKAKLHPEQKNGHLIGIIGAGPAGLTLAILLEKSLATLIFSSSPEASPKKLICFPFSLISNVFHSVT